MYKIVAIVHGRMTSSRLPGKVLKELSGKTVFYHHLERMRQCKGLQSIYLATSKDKSNQPLIDEAKKCGVPYYAGAAEDILERYIAVARKENAHAVIRCGCDKPLFSYEIVGRLIEEYDGEDLLYVTNPLGKGAGAEIISLSAMEKVHEKYQGPAITKYMHEYPYLFKIKGVEVDDELSRPEFRIALDTKEDYELMKVIYEKFYTDGTPIDIKEVFKFLDDHPDVANINRFVEEKQVNEYVKDLIRQPVFSIYQNKNGKYVVNNRMNEVVTHKEFKDILKGMQWEEI